ncbi:choice-of-anchor D domain-containing protein [Roseateles aquatilis]|nr:choice-of-anchor D domain-containing protein [Roseateles aquatilis]
MNLSFRTALPGAIVAIAAAVVAAPALAADPIAGRTKFSQVCAGCHTVASTAVVDRGRNNPAMIQNAINTIPQMGSVSGRFDASDLADIAAYLGNSPASLSFAQTAVGQSSAVSTITISASRIAALGNLSATASGDFVVQGGNCGSTVPAGTSCTVGVVFQPTAAGSRNGALTISHNGISTPIPIALSGTANAALQAGLSADATTLAFGTQTVGTPSTARTVTLTNTGGASLDFGSIGVSGANAGDFARGGSCAVGTPLAVGATCTVTATFTPAAAGSRSASIAVAATAPAAGGAAVNVGITLSGTGQSAAAPGVGLSATTLSFGTATVGTTTAAQTLTVTNTGNAALSFSAIAATGPFSATHTCGAGVPAAGTCTVAVTFTPTAAGAATGTLSLTSNAAGSPQTVALAGSGALANTAVLAWSPSGGADFGTVIVGADGGLKHFTLSNTGNAAATLGSFRLAGDAAADYRVDATSTCAAGATLAVGASCDLAVGFSPRVVGPRPATVNVASDNATLPTPLTLSGTGQGAPQPQLQLSAAALDFGPADSAGRPLTLTNSGNGPLHIASLALGGTRFSVDTGGTNGCGAAPFTVAPAASCQITLRWLGAGAAAASAPAGTDTDTLTLRGDMTPATATVALSGTAGNAAMSNSGGGGCTIGAGTGAADPLLLLMAGLSAIVLWGRRRGRDVRRGRQALAIAAALTCAALPAARAADVGQPLGVASVPGADGAPVPLHDGKARLTYVDFWASWCGPCRQSFPWMNRMQARYGAQGLRIVAVNLDASREDAQSFLQQVPASVALAFDPKGDTARRVGVRAMPSSVLLGPDGRVLMQHAGFRAEDEAALEARIVAALKTP